MKPGTRMFVLLFMAVSVLLSPVAGGQPGESADRTLSPFFFVKSDDPELDQLPLKSTRADVRVVGVIADVIVTQVYKNEGKKPLEAIYIFPASTRAAVYGMKMIIGERTIIAEIRERNDARRQYEEAKQQGKSASLLEQQRPNVFQMSVANILPDDVIQVELKYTELLVPTDGIYEFVYPTVVGPRYSNKRPEEAPSSEKWVENPYHRQGKSPAYTFDLTASLAAGLPVQQVTSPSHKVDIRYDGPSRASIRLDPSEKSQGNKDFILRYQLSGGKVESGLLLFEGEKENFFLVMVQPPKRVNVNQIPPREYIFIVDVSGSMYGFPLEMSKKLLKDLIGNLRPTDRFNVLLFSGGSSVMSDKSLSATSENINRAIALIDLQKGGGGTELLPAMKRALSLPRSEGFSRTVVIATDGYVTVEEEVFDLIRNSLGDANMFTFGIGTAVNRYIIEGMARIGMGESFVITKLEETEGQADKFRKMITTPVLTKVKVKFKNFEAYDVEPPSIPDVFAERPILVFGKWRGRPSGKIEVQGSSGNGPHSHKIEVRKEKPIDSNSSLRYLWARHRIAVLSDYNHLRSSPDRVKEVTRLGLDYNLLTAYTSFVAIDTHTRLIDGQATTVKQPLPLPEGVSNYALGSLALRREGSAPVLYHQGKGDRLVAKEKDKKEPSDMEKTHLSIDLDEILATDDRTKETVQKVLQQQIASIELCYEQATKDPSDLKGKITFSLVIDPGGKITKVTLASGRLKDKGLERCLVEKLKGLTLSGIENANSITVSISLRFKTS